VKSLHDIAAALQGYDPQALHAHTVNAFLARLVEPVQETETLAIMDALGRVLAADVVSPINVPPHDNSAMDGYALAGAQLTDAPLALRVVGTAMAGKAWQGTVTQGECVKIMTGAVMPKGLDTVVPQELVQVPPASTHITIPPGIVAKGDNCRAQGEDIRAGQVALSKGERLMPAALGLMASLGQPQVTVYRRLTVAYFSTGDEILSLGDPPREGAVYDSNRYTVLGLLTRLGIAVIDLGVVPDQTAALQAAFNQAAQQADAIITSGGVSVGEADHTKTMMARLAGGPEGIAFWRIAMRPGRPMAVGRIPKRPLKHVATVSNDGLEDKEHDCPRQISVSSYLIDSKSTSDGLNDAAPQDASIVFGLPGNPVAVMVTFLAFVRPALLRMMGSREAPPPLLKAKSVSAIRKKPGRTEYQRGTVSTGADGALQVEITGNQGSGVLSSMVRANGLVVLHHDQGSVKVGESVDVMMFDGVI
jgi:molybdopterin molybdotransferase